MDVANATRILVVEKTCRVAKCTCTCCAPVVLSDHVSVSEADEPCAEMAPAPAHPQYPPSAALRAVRIASDEKRQLAAARDVAAAEEPKRIRCAGLQPQQFACQSSQCISGIQQSEWLSCYVSSTRH